MAGEWSNISFAECADLIRDTVHPEHAQGMPYIGLEHIGVGTLALIGHGNAEDVTSIKSRFRRGDILFGKLRPYFRKVIIAPFDGVCSTDIWVVRAKPDTDQRFLFYWMASPEFIEESTRASEGTKMPRAQWEFVERIEEISPPLPEQRAIAHILGTLDDKIELNRRMNETLEAMARALFKSWFVDFDPVRAKMEGCWRKDESLPGLPSQLRDLFPDRLVDSGLGQIPERWEVRRVADIGSVVCGKTPPTRVSEYYGDEVPFITIPDMHGIIFVTGTQKRLSRAGAMSQANKMLPAGAICVSCIATPGLVAMTAEPAQTNQQINTVVPIRKDETYFWFWPLRDLGDDIRAHGSGGSVVTNLSTGRFAELHVVSPPANLRSSYHLFVTPLFDLILENDLESRTLATLRDTLLPKLITGEIRIEGAEKFLKETGIC